MIASVLAAVGTTADAFAAHAAEVQGTTCSAGVGISNAGFEDPVQLTNTGTPITTLPGWSVSGNVVHWGPSPQFQSGSQHVALAGPSGGSVSQSLDGTVLRGETVTFEIIEAGFGTITLGDQSLIVSSTTEEIHTATFVVPDSAADSVLLALTHPVTGGGGWDIDAISGTHTTECPQPVTIEDCMNGDWAKYGFRNQGLCIQFVNTGNDSR